MSLVPYQAGFNIGRYLYNNPRVARGAFKMGRRVVKRMMYRKRKRYSRVNRPYRKRSAFRPPNNTAGTANSKKADILHDTTTALAMSNATLYHHNLAFIPHTTTNDASERQRNLLNIRGFHICIEFSNLTNKQYYLNVGVVVPRDTATGVSNTDFFRNVETGDRGQNFDPMTMSGVGMHCAKINTDFHHVLMHKRYTLAPDLDTLTGADNLVRNNRGNSLFTIDRYVKFNRQVRYSGTGVNTTSGGTPFLVYWVSECGAIAPQGTPATQVQAVRRVSTYFREPR